MAFLTRALLKSACLSACVLILGACSLSPQSGQYTCTDGGPCPEGLTCRSELCVDESFDVGAEDTGPLNDAGNDVGMDGGPDAGPEICEPDLLGWAQDEDEDGAFDEGCGWHFGRPHVVHRAHVRGNHFGVAMSPDGLIAYLGVGEQNRPVAVLRRASVESTMFSREADLDGTAIPLGPHRTVAASGDASLVAVHTDFLAAARVEIFEPTPDGFEILQTIPGLSQPWFSPDGNSLYMHEARTEGLRVVHWTRGEPDFAFESVLSLGPAASLPGLTADERAIFFSVGFAPQLWVAERGSTEDDFGVAEQLDELDGYFRPAYLAESREMWLGGSFGPMTRRIFRVQVCRGEEECAVEAQVACDEEGGERSADGFHCFWRPVEKSAYSDAQMACESAGGHLATIASPEENTAIQTVVGVEDAWIGARRVVPGCSEDVCEFAWVTGEPFFQQNWVTREPADGVDCVMRGPGGWISADCEMEQTVVCEREQLPVWLQPR